MGAVYGGWIGAIKDDTKIEIENDPNGANYEKL